MTLKFKNITLDQQKRKKYQTQEIFNSCCSLLDQAQFSNQLQYFFYRKRLKALFFTGFKNKCLFSGYNKSVISRFKLARHIFSSKILSGSMPGFYRAI